MSCSRSRWPSWRCGPRSPGSPPSWRKPPARSARPPDRCCGGGGPPPTPPGVAISGRESSCGPPRVRGGLAWVVPRGDVACVLGPSGCGKTPLLRVLAGFLPAEAGTVSIGGRVVDDGRHCVAPEDRRVGYVPQEGALFPHLTVAGNVGFALARRSRRQRAARRG